MDVLFKAITTAFNANAAMKAALVNGLHQTEAPQGTPYSYGTFELISSEPQRTFGGGEYEYDIISFQLFSESDSTDEIDTMYNTTDAVYDKGTLTITGYTLVSILRIARDLSKDEDGVYIYTIDYEVIYKKD